jgi:hypothetical protein
MTLISFTHSLVIDSISLAMLFIRRILLVLKMIKIAREQLKLQLSESDATRATLERHLAAKVPVKDAARYIHVLYVLCNGFFFELLSL